MNHATPQNQLIASRQEDTESDTEITTTSSGSSEREFETASSLLTLSVEQKAAVDISFASSASDTSASPGSLPALSPTLDANMQEAVEEKRREAARRLRRYERQRKNNIMQARSRARNLRE